MIQVLKYSISLSIILLAFVSCGSVTSEADSTDISGKETPAEKEWYSNNDGLYCVLVDSLYGFINDKGEIKINPKFEKVGQFSEGLAYFTEGEHYGFINTRGEVVIPAKYKKRSRGRFNFAIEPFGESFFKEGLAMIHESGFFGFINKKGEVAIPARYQKAGPFCDGLSCIQDGQTYYYINQKGEKQFDQTFEYALDFNDGLAVVSTNGKAGYINPSGEVVIPNQYAYAGFFSDGYTVIKDFPDDKVFKLIDEKGNVQFEKKGVKKMRRSIGDYVEFSEGHNQGYFNLKGEIVVEAKFDFLLPFMGEVAIAREQSEANKFGLINGKGVWVVEPKYDGLFPAGKNMVLASTKDKKLGYIDFAGNVIWEMQN